MLYTGKVPDSILAKVNLKSETLVLWKWIQPKSFLTSCRWANNYFDRCPTDNGNLAIEQAARIKDISQHLSSFGSKVGLIADQGMDDSNVVFGLSDSNSLEYRRMNQWLGGINADYLKGKIPFIADGSSSLGTINLDISKSRQRLRTDIRQAATLYSQGLETQVCNCDSPHCRIAQWRNGIGVSEHPKPLGSVAYLGGLSVTGGEGKGESGSLYPGFCGVPSCLGTDGHPSGTVVADGL